MPNNDWIDTFHTGSGEESGSDFKGHTILALHVQEDGLRVMLLWDVEKLHYSVAEVNVLDRVVRRSMPTPDAQEARNTYAEIVMAVLFRLYNQMAPTITYAQRNPW